MLASLAIPRAAMVSVFMCLGAIAAACGTTGIETLVTLPQGAPEAASAATAEVVAQRLDELVGDSTGVEVTDEGLVLEVPDGTDDRVIDLIVALGAVSMHPVLEVLIDETAAANTELGDGEALVADDMGLVYHVGPAFVAAGQFVDGRVNAIEGLGPSAGWVVEPTMTAAGNHAFVEATKNLAAYRAGDPRRQLAIVLDGRVLAAPQLAPEVDPAEGLDPEVTVFTVPEGPMSGERARALAAYLRFGPLPVPLAVVDQ